MPINVFEYYSKRDNLYYFFNKKLTMWELLMDKNAKKYYIISLLFLFFDIISIVYLIISRNETIKYKTPISIAVLLLMLISLFFLRKSVKASNKYIQTKYFQLDIRVKVFSLNYSKEALRIIRTDYIYKMLNVNDIKISDLNDYIMYYQTKGSLSKEKNWYPISLLIFIAFPIYSEYIGYLYSIAQKNIVGSLYLMFALLFLSFLLFVFIYLLRNLISLFLLSEYEKSRSFVDILHTIKTFPDE